MSGRVNHQDLKDDQIHNSPVENGLFNEAEMEGSIVKETQQDQIKPLEHKKSLEAAEHLEDKDEQNHGRSQITRKYACNMNYKHLERDSSPSISVITELTRIREKMGAVYDEECYTQQEIMENPQLVSELVTMINKMWKCYQMQEQQICILREENERLHLHHLQNEKILLKTLDIFDQHLEDQKNNSDSDKQCKSGQSNSAVIEQVQHQQKEILTVKDDCEKLMPNQKKKGMVKRGLRKIKDRFKSGTMVLENPENEVVTSATSNSHCTNAHLSSLQDDDIVHSKIPEVDLTRGVKNSRNGRQSECSRNGDYSMPHSESIITLEDFLAESNKSPESRRKYVDMHSTKATCSSSGEQSISSKEASENLQPRSDIIEIPKFLCRSSPISSLGSYGSVELGISSQSSQTGSEVFHSMDSNCSLSSDELNNRSSYMSSSPSISDDGGPAHATISANQSLLSQQTGPIIKQQFSTSSAPIVKHYVPVKTTDGPSSSVQKSMSLSKCYSSEKLPNEPEEILLQSDSSHKDIDYDSSLPDTAGFTACSQITGKLSLQKIIPTSHQSSSSPLGITSKSRISFSYDV